ncbi:MAG: hypothetical protein LBM62_01930 [Mediterranea sp.]|jgi:AraC-like DNA-binding protein|nr:hypothetical protein [Mediterranea sp.]
MISPEIYLHHALILAPATAALLCGGIVLISLRDSRTRREHQIKFFAMLYLLFNAFTYAGLFVEQFLPALYQAINPLFFLTFILFNVYYYRCVCLLTQITRNEHFRGIHYVLPLILTVLMYVLRMALPAEQYQYVYLSRHPVDLLFSVAYTAAGIKRIYTYFHGKSLMATLALHNSTRWAQVLVTCSLLILSSAFINVLAVEGGFRITVWTLFSFFSSYFLSIEIAYHLLSHSFELYLVPAPSASQRQYKGLLTTETLENYFKRKKPYLNPNFRMSDLADDLDVSRTAISAFINNEYGIHFNRLVNRWRLAEVERLADKDIPLKHRVIASGFTDLKHYNRAKAQEASKNVVPTLKSSNIV